MYIASTCYANGVSGTLSAVLDRKCEIGNLAHAFPSLFLSDFGTYWKVTGDSPVFNNTPSRQNVPVQRCQPRRWRLMLTETGKNQ